MLVDLHVHSNVSFDSKIKLGILLRKLNEIGLDGVAITDHDSIEAIPKAKEIARKFNVKVFSGVEITTKSGHILAYGIDELPPSYRSVRETIDWIQDHAGVAVCAHPFRVYSPSLGELVHQHNFDALEINGRSSDNQNRATEFSANMMRIPLVGGSDAHYIGKVGRISTRFNEEINTDDELITAIRQGKCTFNYQIPVTLRAELIQPLPLGEISIIDKYLNQKKDEILPKIEVKVENIHFFDSKRKSS